MIRAIDKKELIGLIFNELREKATRVYFRIGEQTFKDSKVRSLVKPTLKMRPLDTADMAYFTESTRRGRNGQKQTSLLFMHIDDLVFNNFEIKRQMESVEQEIFGQVQRIPA